MAVELPPLLASIIGWLRAGYPEGLPERDYIPLLALLARRLSDEEVSAIAVELVRQGDVASEAALHEAITAVTHQAPLESDIARVSDRLASGGWFPAPQPRTV
jgi:Protein of unknown function (DUF3349)